MTDLKIVSRGDYTPFLLGLFVGGFVVLISILVFDQIYKTELQEELGVWIAAGATLTAGLLAGWAALHSARVQIKQIKQIEDKRHDASLRASKAMLPSVLAELSRRCEHNCMTVLFNSRNAVNTDASIPEHLSKYPGAEPMNFLEEHEFQVFKDCVEFADIQSAKILTYIVHRYQVLYSRSYKKDFPEVERDRLERVSTPRSINTAFAWNALSMLIEHCLPYALDDDHEISLLFKCSLLTNIFCGSTQSEITRVPKILSSYQSEAEKITKKMFADLADDNGNLDLPFLLKEKYL